MTPEQLEARRSDMDHVRLMRVRELDQAIVDVASAAERLSMARGRLHDHDQNVKLDELLAGA